MAPDKSSSAHEASDREIVSTRIFAAPRARVFDAFADPQQLAQWWGPNGFTNTFQKFDLRPGGEWRFTMRGPDGAEYYNESEFIEIARPARLVFVHLRPMHRFQMTMLFSERDGGKTELTWRMLFESVSEAETFKRLIVEANEQNFDRLAAHLAKTT